MCSRVHQAVLAETPERATREEPRVVLLSNWKTLHSHRSPHGSLMAAQAAFDLARLLLDSVLAVLPEGRDSVLSP